MTRRPANSGRLPEVSPVVYPPPATIMWTPSSSSSRLAREARDTRLSMQRENDRPTATRLCPPCSCGLGQEAGVERALPGVARFRPADVGELSEPGLFRTTPESRLGAIVVPGRS